jgi:DNA repair protein SbcD/Mre11
MTFRLLHCSDLHLGQRLFEQDRSADEEFSLGYIVTLAKNHQVDVVCVSGDIFDTANPGSHEMARYHRWLHRLAFEAGVGTIVVTAGNHDNPLRIEGPRELLQHLHIHVVGSWTLEESPSKVCVPLYNRQKELVGQCAAVPYLREGDVRAMRGGEDHVTAAQAHREALAERFKLLHKAMPRDLPYIVMAHAFVTDGQESGSERSVQVGNLGKVSAHILAGDSKYLALGHLHRPHSIGGKKHWRYSGSLLPTGFDEIDIQRSIVMADIPSNDEATVQSLALPNYRAYRQIKDSALNVEQILRDTETLPPDQPKAWLKIILTDTLIPLGAHHTLTSLATYKGYQLLRLHAAQEQVVSHRHSTPKYCEPLEIDHILAHPNLVFDQCLHDHGIDPLSPQGLELNRSFNLITENLEQLLLDDH